MLCSSLHASGWWSTRKSRCRSLSPFRPPCSRTTRIAADRRPRRSPPASSPANSAAIRRSDSSPCVFLNARTIWGTTASPASILPWQENVSSKTWPSQSSASLPVNAKPKGRNFVNAYEVRLSEPSERRSREDKRHCQGASSSRFTPGSEYDSRQRLSCCRDHQGRNAYVRTTGLLAGRDPFAGTCSKNAKNPPLHSDQVT